MRRNASSHQNRATMRAENQTPTRKILILDRSKSMDSNQSFVAGSVGKSFGAGVGVSALTCLTT